MARELQISNDYKITTIASVDQIRNLSESKYKNGKGRVRQQFGPTYCNF